MRKCFFSFAAWSVAFLGMGGQRIDAQNASDEALTRFRTQVDTMRGLDSISPGDQEVLRRWIQAELERFPPIPQDDDFYQTFGQALKDIHQTFRNQIENPQNKDTFKKELAVQASTVAADLFLNKETLLHRALGLADLLKQLSGLNLLEAIPGLSHGLKSPYDAVRWECANGLVTLQNRFAAADPTPVINALRQTGAAEVEDVVRAEIYRALAIPGQAGQVFDAYLAIMDAKLKTAREGGSKVGKDQFLAFEYLLREADKLAANQVEALVQRLAVFMRLAAERYRQKIDYQEEMTIEITLSVMEELLQKFTGTRGGVRAALETREADNTPDKVIQAAQAWYGTEQTPGVLNADRWKIKPGAP